MFLVTLFLYSYPFIPFTHGEKVCDGSSNSCSSPLTVEEIIPKLDFGKDQDEISRRLYNKQPFVITNNPIVKARWKPPDLVNLLGDWRCKIAKSETNRFLYWSTEAGFMNFPLDRQPTKFIRAKTSKFLKMAKSKKFGQNPETPFLYLQQTISPDNPDFPKAIVDETKLFDWNWIAGKFGNLFDQMNIWMGQKGTKSPAHYDELDNLFVQMSGKKRVTLFPPEDYDKMYVFPLGHACDRQSMVNIGKPRLEDFPLFSDTNPIKLDLLPGDLFYLPPFWFHEFENLTPFPVSLTFWSTLFVEFPEIPPPWMGRNIVEIFVKRRCEEHITTQYNKYNSGDWSTVESVWAGFNSPNNPYPDEWNGLINFLMKTPLDVTSEEAAEILLKISRRYPILRNVIEELM